MKKVPEYFKKRLADMAGYLPDGITPKLRLVFGPKARRQHGKLQGTYKYRDPESGQVMPFWILEQWYPPEMCGSREAWPYELMGPYPADCQLECCRGGFWGLRMPISTDGTFLELNDNALDFIERRQFADIQWSLLSEIERQELLDENLSQLEQKSDEDGLHSYQQIIEDYLQRKETADNADNRVFSFAEKHGIVGRGLKEPIGRPKL